MVVLGYRKADLLFDKNEQNKKYSVIGYTHHRHGFNHEVDGLSKDSFRNQHG